MVKVNVNIQRIDLMIISYLIKGIVAYLTFNSPMITFNFLGQGGLIVYGLTLFLLLFITFYYLWYRKRKHPLLIDTITFIFYHFLSSFVLTLIFLKFTKIALSTSFISCFITLWFYKGYVKRNSLIFKLKYQMLFIIISGLVFACFTNLVFAQQISELYLSLMMILYMSGVYYYYATKLER